MIYLAIFLLLFLSTVALASLSLAPWVPTRKRDLSRILTLASLKPGEIFYDLGCGDGRVAAYMTKHSQAQVVGIELALPFYIICLIRKQVTGNERLNFKFKNLYKVDLSQAGAVYLFPASSKQLTEKLKTKLLGELKPGGRVITYAFPFVGWQPAKVDKPNSKEVSIYLYEIK